MSVPSSSELTRVQHEMRVLEASVQAVAQYASEQTTPCSLDTLGCLERLLSQSRERYAAILTRSSI